MADPKVVKAVEAKVGSSMVVGNKVNWRELSKQATIIKDQLVEVHEAIAVVWKAQKCRELATIESAVRNTVEFLDKLPAAISKFDSSKGGTGTGKSTSLLSKPR